MVNFMKKPVEIWINLFNSYSILAIELDKTSDISSGIIPGSALLLYLHNIPFLFNNNIKNFIK